MASNFNVLNVMWGVAAVLVIRSFWNTAPAERAVAITEFGHPTEMKDIAVTLKTPDTWPNGPFASRS